MMHAAIQHEASLLLPDSVQDWGRGKCSNPGKPFKIMTWIYTGKIGKHQILSHPLPCWVPRNTVVHGVQFVMRVWWHVLLKNIPVPVPLKLRQLAELFLGTILASATKGLKWFLHLFIYWCLMTMTLTLCGILSSGLHHVVLCMHRAFPFQTAIVPGIEECNFSKSAKPNTIKHDWSTQSSVQ